MLDAVSSWNITQNGLEDSNYSKAGSGNLTYIFDASM